jgi:hypothetical protein
MCTKNNRLLLLFLITIFSHSGISQDIYDWQSWTRESISGKITKKIGLEYQIEQRTSSHMQKYGYQHNEVYVDYSINNFFTAGIVYRQIYLEYNDEKYTGLLFTEHRPGLRMNVKLTKNNWQVKDRTQIEYRYYEIDKKDVPRLREKLTIGWKGKVINLTVGPYLSGELFFEQDQKYDLKSRFALGSDIHLYGPIKANLFYQVDYEDRKSYRVIFNVLGMYLSFDF